MGEAEKARRIVFLPVFKIFFRGFLRSLRVDNAEEKTLYTDVALLETSFETGAKLRLRELFPVVLLAKRVCFLVCLFGFASFIPASFRFKAGGM
jgi:hypothetical protein